MLGHMNCQYCYEETKRKASFIIKKKKAFNTQDWSAVKYST